MEKMSFEEFKKRAGEEIRLQLPPKYDQVEPVFDVFRKHSRSYNGMSFRPEGEVCSSVIDLDYFYGRLMKGELFEDLLEDMARVVLTKPPKKWGMIDKILDYETVKNNLFVRICTDECAGDRFDDCPTYRFEEFVLTYNIRVDYSSECYGTVLIDNDMLARYGVSAEQLHKDSLKSGAKLFPACFDSISEIAKKCGDMDDIPLPDCIKEMVIVSDRCSRAGSAVIFYPGLLSKIGKKLKGDYYLLPYSEKCTLAFPVRYEEEMAEYIHFVYSTYNPENDGNLMSRNVYLYDVDSRKLSCCKNVF